MGHGDHGGHADHGHSHGGHGHSHGGHGHGHGHKDLEAPLLDKERDVNAELIEEQKSLKRAVFFALFMMFVEIIGGVMANSLAIITDAAHMLSDVGGFIVSLVCLQLATQDATHEYTYGFKQAEVLGALLSVTIVWALTAGLLMKAIGRFYHLEEINAPYMFAISTLGFFVNLILMKVLGHGHSHGGGHGHSHGGPDHGHGQDHHNEEEASLAMKAAIAHVIGDIVQSLGVCAAALCIWTRPFDIGYTENGVSKWNYADPMCTVLFGILVLITTKSTLSQTINSLMVKAPAHIDQIKLAEALYQCPCVENVHDIHVWAVGSKDILCTAHLMVRGSENSTEALKAAIRVVQKMGIGHSTFQIEIVGEFDPSLESYGLHDNPLQQTGRGHAHDDAGAGGHSHGKGNGHGHEHNGCDHGHAGHGGHADHGHDHGHGGHGH